MAQQGQEDLENGCTLILIKPIILNYIFMSVHFSVIIPTKDRKAILEESLDKLRLVKNLNDLQVIIINDSSEELKLDDRFSFATIYRNPKSGVASARNHGVSNAIHNWIVFVDDDMWAQPDTFERLAAYCADKNTCVNTNWIYPDFIQRQMDSRPFLRYLKKYRFDSMEGWNNDPNWRHDQAFEVNSLNSAFLLIHKDTFLSIEGFDTNFPYAGFEDHDLSKRLKKAGMKLLVDPTIMVFHNEADRLEIGSWMERKKRGAVTRRVGVNLGYSELELQYPIVKKSIYTTLNTGKGTLLKLLKRWPKSKVADSIYFRLVNILLGTFSFAGYTSKHARELEAQIKAKKKVAVVSERAGVPVK
jgi:GT2 family glycosyltransferase